MLGPGSVIAETEQQAFWDSLYNLPNFQKNQLYQIQNFLARTVIKSDTISPVGIGQKFLCLT